MLTFNKSIFNFIIMRFFFMMFVLCLFSIDTYSLELVSCSKTEQECVDFKYKFSNQAAGMGGSFRSLDNRKKSRNSIRNFNQTVNPAPTLQVVSFGFKSLAPSSLIGDPLANLSQLDPTDEVDPEVIGPALIHPNPFRQNSAFGGVLGYRLSKPMEVVIHIYDMLGHLIAKQTFKEGSVGGSFGYNKLKIDTHLLEGTPLSAGVYLFLIMNNNKLLSKGKLAVKP